MFAEPVRPVQIEPAQVCALEQRSARPSCGRRLPSTKHRNDCRSARPPADRWRYRCRSRRLERRCFAPGYGFRNTQPKRPRQQERKKILLIDASPSSLQDRADRGQRKPGGFLSFTVHSVPSSGPRSGSGRSLPFRRSPRYQRKPRSVEKAAARHAYATSAAGR